MAGILTAETILAALLTPKGVTAKIHCCCRLLADF